MEIVQRKAIIGKGHWSLYSENPAASGEMDRIFGQDPLGERYGCSLPFDPVAEEKLWFEYLDYVESGDRNPDEIDARFQKIVDVPESVLARVEKLRMENHQQALGFLNEFGRLGARYASDEGKPWNPDGAEPSGGNLVHASEFWATVLQMKRALWLFRMTTSDAEFVHEAVTRLPRRPGLYTVWVIKWPEHLYPDWASFYEEDEYTDRRLLVSDNPYVDNILGSADLDPLDLMKRYLAKRVSAELKQSSTVLYYSPADGDYREVQLGTPDQHFWRYFGDKLQRVKPARRCSGPGCTNIIRPKLDRGRFCGGTCRQNYNRAAKVVSNG